MVAGPKESKFRQLLEKLDRCTDDRLVNLSGEIRVVESDGDGGVRELEGIEPIQFGGLFRTGTRSYIGKAEKPAVVWQVSESQLPVLQFYKDRRTPRFVCVGSMRSGKTEILVRAAAMLATQFRNADIGMVSPTSGKLAVLWKKLTRILPPAWVEKASLHAVLEPPYILLVNGVRFQFLSAKAPSKQMGSPIHGQDWVAAFLDEEQQIIDEAIGDVTARGSDAPGGWYPMLSTCTISDAPEWRSRLAKYRSDPAVEVYRMAIFANAWIEQRFIDQLKATLPPRQFRMRVLAMEEPPERATYPDFTREKHCRTIPQIGAIDCTERIIGAKYLIGYDPGISCDISVILRCFIIGKSTQPYWWIVDEVVTRPGNPNKHAADLKRHLHTQYDKTKPKDVYVRCDPHTNREDGGTRDIYYEMKSSGFRCQPAVFKRNAPASQAHRAGTLLKNDRIQTVNKLLLTESGVTRLFMEVDESGMVKATETAVSFETSQRDEFFRAEMYKKGDKSDISHPTCAVGYALYSYEHARPSPPVAQKNGD